jgi:hypothetical protein
VAISLGGAVGIMPSLGFYPEVIAYRGGLCTVRLCPILLRIGGGGMYSKIMTRGVLGNQTQVSCEL